MSYEFLQIDTQQKEGRNSHTRLRLSLKTWSRHVTDDWPFSVFTVGPGLQAESCSEWLPTPMLKALALMHCKPANKIRV